MTSDAPQTGIANQQDATSQASASGELGGQVTESHIVLGKHFKMIWLTVTTVTLVLAGADIALSVLLEQPTEAAKQAIAMCDSVAKMGFGGIFGMLGAKALS